MEGGYVPKTLLIVIVSMAGLVGTVSAPAAAAKTPRVCQFPGPEEGCKDPRGRWILEWREKPSDEGHHELWVRSIPAATRTRLLEFDRSVDILWSPDGHAVAIADYSGSSDTTLYVASEDDWTRLVNVEDRLRASLGSVRAIYQNGHRYFEPMNWPRPDQLLFRVRAYDSQQYVGLFRYDLTGKVSRAAKR